MTPYNWTQPTDFEAYEVVVVETAVESVDDGASQEENVGTDCTFEFDDTVEEVVVGGNHTLACMRQTHFETAVGVAVGVALVAVCVYLFLDRRWLPVADSKVVRVCNEALDSVLEGVAAWFGYVFVGEKFVAVDVVVAVVGINQAVLHVDQLVVAMVDGIGQAAVAVTHDVVVVVLDNNPGWP